MRPSCGKRRSAILSWARIFKREITAAFNWRGGDSTSCRMPSIAVANFELILKGLDMNVRGAALERAHEHLVDQPDDRHFGRHVAQMGHIFVVTAAFDRLRRAFVAIRAVSCCRTAPRSAR